MRLFKKLFSREQVQSKPAQAISPIEEQSQDSLVAFIHSQSANINETQKIEAVSQLPFCDGLKALAESQSTSAKLQTAARKRLAKIVDEGSLTSRQLLSEIADIEALLVISTYCKSDALTQTVLAHSDEQALNLVQLCQTTHSAPVRCLLAKHIEAPEQLRELLNTVKGRDKNAYKIIKLKLDEIKQLEQKEQERQKQINELSHEAKVLSERDTDIESKLRLRRIERRWSSIAEFAKENEQQLFDQFIQICREKIDVYELKQEEEKAREHKANHLDEVQHTVIKKLGELIGQIYALDTAEQKDIDAIMAQLGDCQTEWRELSQLGKTDEVFLKEYTLSCDALKQICEQSQKVGTLKQCIKAFNDGGDIDNIRQFVSVSDPLTLFKGEAELEKAINVLATFDQTQERHQADEEKRKRILGGLIRKAHVAVEQGRLRQAIGMRHSIDEKLAVLESSPSHFDKQIQNLDEQIQKLVDWQNYAVLPKKEALIEEMKQLVGVDIAPEQLAIKIKKLQDEWKSLRQSGENRSEDLWHTFSELADKAYEPCKIHYQQLSDQRQHNVIQRQGLVAQLEEYEKNYDWEKANWRDVEKVVRTARREWHRYSPVDSKANRPIKEAFDEKLAFIQDKINQEYAKNKGIKEQIIVQAKRLGDIANIQQAIEAAKRLQNQWKSTGHCEYKDNEQLWKEFRSLCDAVFERKSQHLSEIKTKEEEIKAQAQALVDKIKTLNEQHGEALLASRSERDAVLHQFDEIDELPEKIQKKLQNDLNKANKALDEKINAELAKREEQAWDTLFHSCELINEFLLRPKEEQNLEELEQAIFNDALYPEGGKAVLRRKLEHAPSTDKEESLKQLRILCIRAEIMAEQDSPLEDKTLRMEYQMQALQNNGAQHIQGSEAVLTLAKAWATSAPVDHESYLTLFKRFHTIWKQLPR